MARKPAPIDVPLPQDVGIVTEDDLSFIKFLEGKGQRVEVIDPLSDEGLRLQAIYVQNFSQHPMDVLRRIMENVYSDPKDRIASAKTLMEYTLRKPTQNLAVDNKTVQLNIDPAMLKALSAEELSALECLLDKASAASASKG